jgi:hypothetical protein
MPADHSPAVIVQPLATDIATSATGQFVEASL